MKYLTNTQITVNSNNSIEFLRVALHTAITGNKEADQLKTPLELISNITTILSHILFGLFYN
jgi:hypothetical protein